MAPSIELSYLLPEFMKWIAHNIFLRGAKWATIIVVGLAAYPAILPAKVDGISAETFRIGERGDGLFRAWVYFTHKPRSLALVKDQFVVSAAAYERRARRGSMTPSELNEIDRSVSLDFLLQIRNTGAKVRRVSRWLNAVSVEASRDQLESLAELSFVKSIQPLRRTSLAPVPENPLEIYAPPVDALAKGQLIEYGISFGQLELMNVPAVHEQGYTGKGIIVLMLDTGFYQEHQAITPDRIIAQHDFLESDGNTQNETEDEDRFGQHNHGTYTYSALGGYVPGILIGPAFEVKYLLAKTEAVNFELPSEEDNYVAGLEWGEQNGAHIVSSSLGYLDWYSFDSLDGQTAVTTKAVRIATRLGMLVVTAAGNEANNQDWGGHILAPADADSILAVGAVSSSGQLASFSSLGPTFDGRIKPDVVAQGLSVVAASSTGPDMFATISGTSLSTPLVSGSAALLLQAHPGWSPIDVWDALRLTASQAQSPDNAMGYGIINVSAALNYDTLSNDPPGNSSYTLSLSRIHPNPVNSSQSRNLMIKWTIGQRSNVGLNIYNLLGQKVVNLYNRPTKLPGPGSVLWRGVDDQGRPVPSGIYFVRLSAGQETRVQRLVILR